MKVFGFWTAVILLNITVFVGVTFGFAAALPCTSLVQLCQGWDHGPDHFDCCVPPNGGETYALGDPADPTSATGRPMVNAKCGTRTYAEQDAEGIWRCTEKYATCGFKAVSTTCSN